MAKNNSTKVAVRRQLQPAAQIGTADIVRWVDRQGTEIALTVEVARELFKSKHPYTDAEVLLFLHQARSRGANPFTGDIYPIKYSREDPMQLVTGYHFLMQSAKRNPHYQGFAFWCVDENGKRIPDGLETEDNVVAAVCEVYVDGYREPVKFVARMKEFNKHQALWKTMALVLLGKCSIGNAHRLADPALGRMYLAEEVGQGYVVSEEVEGEAVAAEPAEAEPAAKAAEAPPATAEPEPEPAEPEPEAPAEAAAQPELSATAEALPTELSLGMDKAEALALCERLAADMRASGIQNLKVPMERAELGVIVSWYNRQAAAYRAFLANGK